MRRQNLKQIFGYAIIFLLLKPVYGITPTVTSVSATGGTYKAGDVVSITITFDQVVDVDTTGGTPQLLLNNGGVANYSSGSGSNNLLFNYTVPTGATASPLNYLGTNSLVLNGGSITETAPPNDAADLTLPAPGGPAALGASGVVLDGIAPQVLQVSGTNGTYIVGNTITIDVEFTEVVDVTGTPQLYLATGSPAAVANYSGGTGTNTLSFTFTVAAGMASADLDVTNSGALILNGGTIRDSAGNNAVLTLPSPGGFNSLSANNNIVVDGVAPTVVSVTSSTANGAYSSGSISIQITFSEAVTGAAGATLALNSGGTATYTSGDGTSVLTFTYTIAAGENSADLDYVASGSLSAPALTDLPGNAAILTLPAPGAAGSLGNAKNIVIDTTQPAITSVTTSQPNGVYGVGAVIPITVTFSEAVTLTAPNPTLTLNSGGSANYSAGNGTTTFLFNYTVVSGHSAAALDVTALTIGGGLADAAGNAVNTGSLPMGAISAVKTIAIDTTAPDISNVVSPTPDGTYKAGDVIIVRVLFSEPTSLAGGNLVLTLDSGGSVTIPPFPLSSQVDGFYTVQPGESSADLTVTAVSLTGSGALSDAAGNANTTPTFAAGWIATGSDIVIDATAPQVLSLTGTDGNYRAGQNIDITVTFDDIVNVTGSPQLQLETGAVKRFANYLSGSGSAALVFRYTVQAGDSATDLDVLSPTSLYLNGGSIRDSANNPALLTLPLPGAPGSLSANQNIVVDTTAPVISSVTSPTANGIYTVGGTITITVNFSEAVTLVGGNLVLNLDSGGTVTIAPFGPATAASGVYTVAAGENSGDLNVSSASLSAGTLRDAAGNDASLALPAGNNLANNKDLIVDTGDPTVTAVTSTTAAGTYGAGAQINVTVQFSEAVTLTGGNLVVTLTGGQSVTIPPFSNSSIVSGTFTIPAGYSATPIDSTALSLSAGTLRDAAGNDADLTLPGTVLASANINANGAVPGVTSLTGTNGTYKVGDVVTVTVTFSEAVNVTGTPQLLLETGASDATANYTSGSGTANLNFQFTVASGMVSADLDVVAANSLLLSGGTIRSVATNVDALLALPSPGSAGSLSVNQNIVIDGVAPTVLNVSSSTANGSYSSGTINITIVFSENVTGAAGATLALNSGGTATYSAGDGSNSLTFQYTIAAGENSADLDYVATSSLTAASLTDMAGNPAVLTLPLPGSANSLAGQKNIIIDTTAPQITQIVSTNANGTYDAGAVIAIDVTFSEPVTLAGAGAVTLGLNGGTDAVYSSGSGSTTLRFFYTVAAGDAANPLNVTGGITLGGTRTLRDAAGNNADLTTLPGGNNLSDNNTLVIDTAAPTVTAVTSSTPDGTYRAGQIVSLLVNFSKPVVVTGSPRILLNSGAAAYANYVSGTGSTQLTLNYLIAAGENTAPATRLNYANTTDFTLNGGTINSLGAVAANLTLPNPATNGLETAKNLYVDTVAPTVVSITSPTADGSYGIGGAITIQVQFSENVTVSGTPSIALNSGGTALYTAGSGTNTLTFNYTVAAGHSSADLDYTATTALTGSIADIAGNAANATLPTPGGAGSIANAKALVIDGIAPTLLAITSTTTNGYYNAGDNINLTLQFSEPVTLASDNLEITLNSTATLQTIPPFASATTASATYTIAAGHNANPLNVTALALAGSATLRDAAGNDLSLTLPLANNLADNKTIVVDTTAPAIASVTSTTANGTYGAGANINLTVNFTEPVTLAGVLEVTLDTGRTIAISPFTNSNTAIGVYTVQVGDVSLDLNANSPLVLASGTLQDLAGNAPATLNIPGGQNLADNKAIVIDADVPTVTNVTATNADGAYGVGADIDIQVVFSKNINVTGTPYLVLATSPQRQANYLSHAGNTITFRYTVQAGDVAADLGYHSASALALNGGSINDGTNNAILTLPNPGVPNSLDQNKNITIDGVAATVTNVTSSSANGSYNAGNTIPITVTFDKAVRVTGTPRIQLNSGAGVYANYTAGDGTTTLTFDYTVAAGHTAADLDYSSAVIDLNGGLINTNAIPVANSPTNANLNLPAIGSPGSLGSNRDIVIDTTDPTIVSISSLDPDGTYGNGETLQIRVTFSENVTVAGGTPTLSLDSTGTATYTAGSGTTTLIFDYLIAAGHNSADLNVTALNLGTATIRDAATNNADLTLPAGNNLADNKNLVVDTAPAIVTNVTSALPNGSYKAGDIIPIQVVFNKPVVVTGGPPQLTLNTGANAVYVAGTGTSTLTFNYTVTTGHNTADLDYTATTALTTTGTIQSLGGINANLTLAAPAAPGSLGANKNIIIDTIHPTITNVDSSTGDGYYKAGDVISIEVTFSEAVWVTGTPSISLNSGGTAFYSAGNGTATLTFLYTVGTGQNIADLEHSNRAALTGTIFDLAGNGANLLLPDDTTAPPDSLGENRNIVIDTIKPVLTAVNSATANGSYRAGDVIAITLTFSEDVILAGGSLDATLNSGAPIQNIPPFAATSSITFNYTIGAGENSADLNISALALNGATLRDLAGNDISGALPNVTLPLGNNLADFKNLIVDTTAPTVVRVYSPNTNGTYYNGNTLTIRVEFSEVVNVVGGPPQLTLETGTVDAVIDYVSGSGTNTLSFSYTVATPHSTPDLDYVSTTALALNGATIRDVALNDAVLTLPLPGSGDSLGGANNIVIDAAPAIVTNVTSSTPNGAYRATQNIFIQVTFNKTVTVTGAPTLALNSGGTATYNSGSGTNTISFVYTILPGHTSADLDYNATTSLTPVGSIQDPFGVNADLTLPTPGGAGSLGDNKQLVVDTTAPTVLSVTSSTANGSYGIGQAINITVTFSEPVQISGGALNVELLVDTPTRKVNLLWSGLQTAVATDYYVFLGENSADLDSGQLLLGTGAVITDAAGNVVAPGAGPVALPYGTGIAAGSDIVIDTTQPTIVSIFSNPTNDTNTYIAGGTITVDVTFSEPVTISAGGQLRVVLDTGAEVLIGPGGPAAVHSGVYTVASGHNTDDLESTNIYRFSGTIRDAAGNNAIIAMPTVNVPCPPPAVGTGNTIADCSQIVVDTDLPRITHFQSSTLSGIYGAGDVINVTVQFSENVTLSAGATLTLPLNAGGGAQAVFTGPIGPTNTFSGTYTVGPLGSGQNTLDLAVDTSAVTLVGGTLRDAGGNDVPLTPFALSTAINISATKDIIVDTVQPTVVTVSSTTPNGHYRHGQVIPIQIVFSEPVLVTGTPTLTLETGANDAVVNYTSGSGSTTLVFTYTVDEGQNHTANPLDYLNTTALALSGGAIDDYAGNPAILTLAVPGAPNSLSANRTLIIDTTYPFITMINSGTANGIYGVGGVINIDLTFSEPVILAGAGTLNLTLDSGATVSINPFVASTTASVSYTVALGHNSPDLDVLAATLIGAATLRDLAGNDITGALPNVNLPAGNNLADNKALIVDTTSPVVVNITSPTADGIYTVGDTISIHVTFSQPVFVTGTPQLALDTGGLGRLIDYSSGSGTPTLVFTYTVAAGENSPDLDYLNTGALTLNSGTIQDAGFNNANLTLYAPGTGTVGAGALSVNKNIVIDTANPTLTAGLTTPPLGVSGTPHNTSPGTFTLTPGDTGSGWDGNFWWCVDTTNTCNPYTGAQEIGSNILVRDFAANSDIGLRYFRFGVKDLAGNNSPVASVPNRFQDAPVLDFPQTTLQYQTKGVNFTDNESGAGFYTFAIVYTDTISAATSVELWIDLDGNGSYEPDERKTMLLTGGVPATGATYEISVNVPFIRATNGLVRYRFYATNGGQDAVDGPQAGDPTVDNFMQLNPYALDFPERVQVRNNYQKPGGTKPVVILVKDPKAAGQITIDIYLPNGKLVKSLYRSANYNAAEAVQFWNITDNNGSKVNSGVYMVVVRTPAFVETHKVIVVR